MKPINSSEATGCPELLSSNCVKWSGPNISALNIKTGDNITKVEYALATKICSILNQLDLSDLDLSCLEATIPAGHYNVKEVLQFLLANQCTLKELIENVSPGTGNSTIDITTINLKCLKKYDEFDNEVTQTFLQALQSIVNEICNHKVRIGVLEDTVVDLQTQINSLDLTPTVNIPSVTTCISGPKAVTLALADVATEVCDMRDILGDTLDLQDALSKQCANLKTKIGAPTGFVDIVSTIADGITNMELAICNILARLNYIETTCCAPSCDAIKIGFTVEFTDNQTCTIHFTSGAGTFIPAGFTDCGSTLTITNQTGVEFSPTGIVISQGGNIEDIDLSMFNSRDTLIFSFMAKLCNDDIHCEKCVAKEVEYIADDCCVLTATDDVTVIYKICGIATT